MTFQTNGSHDHPKINKNIYSRVINKILILLKNDIYK